MTVEYASVRLLAQQMHQVPMELRRELRPKLRAAGEQIRQEMQSTAAGFSTRIPGAIRMTTGFGSKTGGVRIFVDAGRAPHARPLENMGQAGTFRHPVFGDRDNWVEQQAHPFFFPVVKRSGEKVRSLVADAVRASWPAGGAG